MKSVIIASLFLLPQAYAACTYDVAPIRALFNTIDSSPSYEGSRTERETLPDGSVDVRRTNGGWSAREVSPDNWRFVGEFCTDSFCKDFEMHFRIVDGCLKLGPSGDQEVTVNAATSRLLDYSMDIGDLTSENRFTHTRSSNTLSINQDIYDGKVRVFSSRFKGRPVRP